jgi:hypothetical protein
LSWIRQRRLVKTQAFKEPWPVTDPNPHSQ